MARASSSIRRRPVVLQHASSQQAKQHPLTAGVPQQQRRTGIPQSYYPPTNHRTCDTCKLNGLKVTNTRWSTTIALDP